MTLLPAIAGAADIISEVRDPGQSPAAENGGFLEIGLAAGVVSTAWEQDDPADNSKFSPSAGLLVSGSYQYKRVFVEAALYGLDGLNLGATVWQNERWMVDFLALNLDGELNFPREDPDGPSPIEEQRDGNLLGRAIGYAAAGTRITGYFGDTIAQFRLTSDYYNSHGIIGSARIGRQWLAGNWKIQGLFGVRYNSAKINQSWYGIDPEEATSRFPVYRADGSLQLETQLGISYPLSRNWVFRSDLLYIRYPAAITSSPLLANDRDLALVTGFSYVF
ncbi:MAG: MipA/OmpV family protein [Granulosicoccus sp.]